MIHLRRPVEADAQRIAEIYVESWNKGFGHLLGNRPLTAELVERWREDLASSPVRWIAAVVDGTIVGLSGVGPSRDPIDSALGELDTIAVDPGHWRQGVGRCLMDQALEWLRESWPRAIVWTPANYLQGHAFYEATGWRPLGLERADGVEVAFGRTF